GQNYRLWWTSKPKGEYVIWAKLFDLDNDGTKEIVAVLDLKGKSDLRALAIYRLEGGRYRKVVQQSLPKEKIMDNPELCGIVPTNKGFVIVLQRERQLVFYLYRQQKLDWVDTLRRKDYWLGLAIGLAKETDDVFATFHTSPPQWFYKLISFLPAHAYDWLLQTLGYYEPKTAILSFDGRKFRIRQVWEGNLEDIGKAYGKTWLVTANKLSAQSSLYRYRLLFGEHGRYQVIWQRNLRIDPRIDPITSPSLSADLDGDGEDELVFVDYAKRQVQVFKVVPFR
ncbi:MAG: hypothetical protein NZ805_09965, partial [Armatimonadetes bacterium]|nr:hypothetical protein [Armatimonadota bacterium]MDW8028688.1 hypothetical protein [Armatimonadota bacterium]